MKKIVIAGYGGFGREVEWLIHRINSQQKKWDFIGYIDYKDVGSGNVIGDDSFIKNINEELYVAIAIGNSKTRGMLFEEYSKNPYVKFPNLIDPSVLMSTNIKIGEGNIICAGSILTVDITIGNGCIINLDCTVGHDSVIKNYITINPSSNVSGNVKINDYAEIGTGCKIIQGIEIGNNSIIGAGAVVVRNIPESCTAVGVPAKVIKSN